MKFTEFRAALLVKSIGGGPLFGNIIQSSAVMKLSPGSLKDRSVFLEALVLYVLIWVCSESVV